MEFNNCPKIPGTMYTLENKKNTITKLPLSYNFCLEMDGDIKMHAHTHNHKKSSINSKTSLTELSKFKFLEYFKSSENARIDDSSNSKSTTCRNLEMK